MQGDLPRDDIINSNREVTIEADIGQNILKYF
jgi:hypothetical protein